MNEEGMGGIIDIDTLTRRPAAPPKPKTPVESITETIERIVTMPSMQPILEQLGNLMSAYATKIIKENNSQSPRGDLQRLPEPKPIFGIGSNEE